MAELEINTSDVVKLSIFTEIFLLHPCDMYSRSGYQKLQKIAFHVYRDFN